MDRRTFVRTASGFVLVSPFAAGTPDTRREPPRARLFAPPNILKNAGFETDWDGFRSFGPGDPTGVTRARDFARSGQVSAKFEWSPNRADTGAQFAYAFPPQDRVWVRFHFRLTSGVSTTWKLCRNRARGFGALVGGLFVERGSRILTWGFDTEVGARTAGIGIHENDVLDGAWHSIEYDYWRNGDPSGFPSVAFWFDGDAVTGGTSPRPSDWHAGRLVAGERSVDVRIGVIQLMGTLNGGNHTSGQCHIDDVAISSVGRIGP